MERIALCCSEGLPFVDPAFLVCLVCCLILLLKIAQQPSKARRFVSDTPKIVFCEQLRVLSPRTGYGAVSSFACFALGLAWSVWFLDC